MRYAIKAIFIAACLSLVKKIIGSYKPCWVIKTGLYDPAIFEGID